MDTPTKVLLLVVAVALLCGVLAYTEWFRKKTGYRMLAPTPLAIAVLGWILIIVSMSVSNQTAAVILPVLSGILFLVLLGLNIKGFGARHGIVALLIQMYCAAFIALVLLIVVIQAYGGTKKRRK